MRNKCAAVIVAAGAAARMQGIDKMLAPLAGVPVVLRTARALAESGRVDSLVIVTRKELVAEVSALCGGVKKLHAVVPGGASRAESVLAGLQALPEGTELAAVHDGARPLVTVPVIDAAIEEAERCGAVAPALPVHDTIKEAAQGVILSTPEQ